jgi:hypothetical protein
MIARVTSAEDNFDFANRRDLVTHVFGKGPFIQIAWMALDHKQDMFACILLVFIIDPPGCEEEIRVEAIQD